MRSHGPARLAYSDDDLQPASTPQPKKVRLSEIAGEPPSPEAAGTPIFDIKLSEVLVRARPKCSRCSDSTRSVPQRRSGEERRRGGFDLHRAAHEGCALHRFRRRRCTRKVFQAAAQLDDEGLTLELSQGDPYLLERGEPPEIQSLTCVYKLDALPLVLEAERLPTLLHAVMSR